MQDPVQSKMQDAPSIIESAFSQNTSHTELANSARQSTERSPLLKTHFHNINGESTVKIPSPQSRSTFKKSSCLDHTKPMLQQIKKGLLHPAFFKFAVSGSQIFMAYLMLTTEERRGYLETGAELNLLSKLGNGAQLSDAIRFCLAFGNPRTTDNFHLNQTNADYLLNHSSLGNLSALNDQTPYGFFITATVFNLITEALSYSFLRKEIKKSHTPISDTDSIYNDTKPLQLLNHFKGIPNSCYLLSALPIIYYAIISFYLSYWLGATDATQLFCEEVSSPNKTDFSRHDPYHAENLTGSVNGFVETIVFSLLVAAQIAALPLLAKLFKQQAEYYRPKNPIFEINDDGTSSEVIMFPN